MAKLDEIQDRRRKLLKMLSEQESMTLEACMHELNIGKRTLLSDIADLRSQNYEIKREKNILYGLKISNFSTYEHSSRATARQASILRLFQENNSFPKNIRQLYLLYNTTFGNHDSAAEITMKTFYRDIRALINNGYLTKNKDQMLSPTPKVYKTLNFSSADSDQMLTHLYNYSHGDALDPIADNIIHKISRELYYKLCTSTDISPAPYYTFKKKYPKLSPYFRAAIFAIMFCRSIINQKIIQRKNFSSTPESSFTLWISQNYTQWEKTTQKP